MEKGILRRGCRLVAPALLILAALPGSAGAATIAATSMASDSNDSMLGDADALCSVREAVLAMNQGNLTTPRVLTDCSNSADPFGTMDTIMLGGGVHQLQVAGTGNDNGTTGDLDALVNLTILGNAADPPTIREVGDTDRVLHAPGNTNLTLRDLNVDDGGLTTGGIGQLGGNILYGGNQTLLLDNVNVLSGLVDTNNPGDAGGGIAANGGGQVTIQNTSVISANVAGPSMTTTSGGGIFIAGAGTDLTITNSQVIGNQAGFGAPMGGEGVGGGIALGASGTSTVNLTNTVIDSNKTGGGAVAANDGSGGGIATAGGSTPAISIMGGAISGNVAGGGSANGQGFGGGIFDQGLGSTLMINGTEIASNRAGGNGGSGQGAGGGIYTLASTTLQNSIIDSNDAGFDNGVDDAVDPNGEGGGIRFESGGTGTLTIQGSTINGNRAGERGSFSNQGGGGVQMLSDGALTITDSVISNNQAGQSYGDNIVRGGGIEREAAAVTPSDSILRSVISGNSAGGGGDTLGGGVYAATRGTFSIRDSTVSGNTSLSSNSQGIGGGLALEGGSTAAPMGAYPVENVTVSGNMAVGPAPAAGAGGGIAVDNSANFAPSVTINHSTIAFNTAQVGSLPPGGGNLQTGPTVAAGDVDLRASIISGGVSDATQENCAQNVAGAIDSQGFNLEGPPSTGMGQCGLDMPMTDAITDPLLNAMLTDNDGPDIGAGGFTQGLRTHSFTTASPAFNRVTTGCPPPATDARGFARPMNACDSGAYELVDMDGDGLFDTSDDCPTVPGPVSNGGCPLPVVNPPVLTPLTPTTPAAPKKKKCKKKKKGASAAKKCRRKKR